MLLRIIHTMYTEIDVANADEIPDVVADSIKDADENDLDLIRLDTEWEIV